MNEQVKAALLTQNFDGMVKGPKSSPNQAMDGIEQYADPNVFSGLGESEKLAGYQAGEHIAIVQSAGLFTPCVYDAEQFGAICAAHALNDIYAVNADPKVGLNLVGFPNCQKPDLLGDILAGGAYKVKEAGAVLVGGHTIQDDELKYGLCVTGFVDSKEMWTKKGAQAGDVLVLTKAVGTGYIACAAMADMAPDDVMEEAGNAMAFLNKYAVDLVREENLTVHACCEVTGYGLVEAVSELALEGQVSVQLDPKKVPVLRGALECADMGLVPGLLYENKERAGEMNCNDVDWLFCPEISGGLILSMPKESARQFLELFEAKDYPVQAAVIADVTWEQDRKVQWTR
jgi:selenide,water dikinase